MMTIGVLYDVEIISKYSSLLFKHLSLLLNKRLNANWHFQNLAFGQIDFSPVEDQSIKVAKSIIRSENYLWFLHLFKILHMVN